MENEENKASNPRAASKGAHQTQFLPLQKPNFTGA
jgi:hypothetical protein